MMPEFYPLKNQEIELLMRAPLLVSILIAGADGDIDQKEMKQAIQQARKNASKSNSHLKEFYKQVGEDFEDKMKVLMATFPHEPGMRNNLIVKDLSQVNSIYKKLPKTFATELHTSLCELARDVAASSGGVFGMNKVGEEEARWVTLPMLQPPNA